MTPQAFLAAYPEFRQADSVLVAAKLAEAATRMGMAGDGQNVWGPFALPNAPGAPPVQPTTADVAQGALAAHYLITSPFGTGLRIDMSKSNGDSVYLQKFKDLEASVAGGFSVAGVVV
jgi:hypothetical protein